MKSIKIAICAMAITVAFSIGRYSVPAAYVMVYDSGTTIQNLGFYRTGICLAPGVQNVLVKGNTFQDPPSTLGAQCPAETVQ